jgi:hypothetical protein
MSKKSDIKALEAKLAELEAQHTAGVRVQTSPLYELSPSAKGIVQVVRWVKGRP